ncbi:hypothetical protein [Streptomyces sp. NPDC090026]|uniref:hypothetical protein n=1 Tax=Streptomyces sp. NPDC090026 TaxID=3365923 RepID=UPI0038116314
MRVVVNRSQKVPSGKLTFRDVRERDPETGELKVVKIILDFHDKDITPGYESDMSEAFTIEAQRWAEAEHPRQAAASSYAPVIRVERLPSLLGGTKVSIEDDLDHVDCLFLKAGITEAGARAYRDFLKHRAKSWRRTDG